MPFGVDKKSVGEGLVNIYGSYTSFYNDFYNESFFRLQL